MTAHFQVDQPIDQQPNLFVLCQDCLHTDDFTMQRHLGSEPCSKCGGEYCGCYECSQLAANLFGYPDAEPVNQVKPTQQQKNCLRFNL